MSNELFARRRSLITFAVLLPAVIWMSAREDFAIARQSRATNAIDAMPAQAAQFSGFNWRLIDLKAAPTERTPEATQVEARLQIIATAREAAQSMRNCRVYLEDSTGQRWSAQPSRRGDISCAQLPDIDATEKPVMLVARFVIPTYRAEYVSLAVVIPKQRPRYLRFHFQRS
ncbi:hypothetical protein [Peristeroidobacter agariperforans]|uniref:hypothetical protein n=1 Tax=Peristeroidobacter agariperforans TaxID=268404 RepID=UPI00101DDE86|nr:hypothetical protein [Peristeroidobacter agariperforans]